MNYRNRPVFEFPVDWGNPVNKSHTFDLGEVQLGYGAPFFTSLQQNVVHGFEFTLRLLSDDDILAIDTFTAALSGMLVGFWLPGPIEAMEISAAISATQFDIVAQGLADTWQYHPAQHLYFALNGITAAAKLTAVVDLGNGFERVTLDQAIGNYQTLFTAAATIQRLHYVRLAEDVEEGTFISEGQQDRSFRVIELPAEYSAYETGEKKLMLFHIWMDAPVAVHWRYTSFAANVNSGNQTYSAFPMEAGEYRRGLTLDGETLTISAKYDPNHPFALFLPVPIFKKMNIQVLEATLDNPDVATVFFSGEVVSVPEPGDRVTANCESWTRRLAFKIPGRLIGPDCPYAVYEPRTCKVVRAKFETTGTIAALEFDNEQQVAHVTLDFPTADRQSANWFKDGWIEMGFGLDYELRTVLSSTWDAGSGRLILTLNAELVHAQAGDRVQLIPGCDGTAATCQKKFDNYINNGAFTAVPSKSPSLTSVNAPVSTGGKGK